jgi:hypothetical protein
VLVRHLQKVWLQVSLLVFLLPTRLLLGSSLDPRLLVGTV